jgi:hypothetical protein
MRTWPWEGSIADGAESENGRVQIMINSSGKSYDDDPTAYDLPYVAFEMTGARGYARLKATADTLSSDIIDFSGRILDHWETTK